MTCRAGREAPPAGPSAPLALHTRQSQHQQFPPLVQFFREQNVPHTAPAAVCTPATHVHRLDVADPHLFDPISRTHLRLPSMATIPGVLHKPPEPRIFPKIIISPSSPFTAAANSPTSSNLFFARKDDHSWIRINTPGYRFRLKDIIFYKKQLYAVTDIGQLVAFDLSDPSRPPAITLTVQPPFPRDPISQYFSANYLVESSGHLFQVWRQELSNPMFRAFKMNTDDKCVEVRSIGEDTCFLGHNDPIALSEQQQRVPRLKSKCLYLTHKLDDGSGYGLEMFNMGLGRYSAPVPGGSFLPLIPGGRQCHHPLVWFTPRFTTSSLSKNKKRPRTQMRRGKNQFPLLLISLAVVLELG